MTTRAAFCFVALCAFVRPAAAQGPPLALPQPSPAATVSQQIGLTDITIAYHRPAVGKRQVWGGWCRTTRSGGPAPTKTLS